MQTIQSEIVIAAPISRVWDALVDLPNYDKWNPYLIKIEGVAEAGTEIVVHSRRVPNADPVSQPVLVTAVEPPQVMRWEGGLPNRGQFKGDHWWVLEPLGSETTRLRQFEHFTGELAAAILNQHRETIIANFIRFNEALKERVEGQS